MAYIQNGLIEAVDFNTFRTQLLQVYGVGFGNSGYGQTAIAVPSVTGGLIEVVKSLEWTGFRNAISVSALHQGTASTLLPPDTDLQPGDTIYAHDGVTNTFDFSQMLADISTNRLLVAPTSRSLFVNRSTQTVSNAWSSSATTTVDISWPSVDHARYFFNSRGEIHLRISRTGGANTGKNNAWNYMLNNVSPMKMDYNSFRSDDFLEHPPGYGTGTPGVSYPYGYYTIPSVPPFLTLASFTRVATGAPVNAFPYNGFGNGNNVTVRAHTVGVSGVNGDNGHTVRFQITLTEPSGGPVDGDLSVIFDEYRATTHLNIVGYTANIVTPLVAV